jgi:Ca2+-binding RTX toxin-like protein
MRRFLSKLLGPGAESKPASRPAQLGVERLESRELLAQGWAGITSPGVLTINASNYDDTVQVTSYRSMYSLDRWLYVDITNLGSTTSFGGFAASSVNRIIFNGGAGYDYFRNNTWITTEAHGGGDRDILVGGSGIDYLWGDEGNDDLYGQGGGDWLWGGNGSDWLEGGAGNDILYGESGMDYLFGQDNDDWLDGGYDGTRDYLSGGWGKDRYNLHQYYSWSWWSWSYQTVTEQETIADRDYFLYDYYLDTVQYWVH